MPAPQDPRIIGHWRLVETRAWDEHGTPQPNPYGPFPLGIVTLTAEGRMLAVLSDGRPDLPPGTPRDYRSYIGAYSFDGTTLHTIVDGADTPDWLATQLLNQLHSGTPDRAPPEVLAIARELLADFSSGVLETARMGK